MKYLIISLLLICCLGLYANDFNRLSFTQENLTFRLGKKIWKVDGDYWFTNATDKPVTQKMYFPIPEDTYIMPAEEIELKLKKPLKGQSCKMLSVSEKGFWFEVTLPAKTIAVCNIKYQQKLLGWVAKYVLLTANSWGSPLEYAKYTLIMPSSFKAAKLSHRNAKVKQKWNKLYYTWEYTNYQPKTDFEVEFKY